MSGQTWRYLNEAAEWVFALAKDDPTAGSGRALARLCDQLIELVGDFGRLGKVDVEWFDGETSGDWDAMRGVILGASRVELITVNFDLRYEREDSALEVLQGGASVRVSVEWEGDRLSPAEDGLTLALRLSCNLHDPGAEGRANRTLGLRNLPRLWRMLHRLHTNLDGHLLETYGREHHVGPYGFDAVPVWPHEQPRPRVDGSLEPWLVKDGRGIFRAIGDRPLLVTRGHAVDVDWLDIAMAIRGDLRRLAELLWLGYDDDGIATMIEGRPLGEPAGLEVDDPIGLTLQVADVMEEMWRADETLHGMRPESIWVERGRMTHLTHRWPLFLELTCNPSIGVNSPFDTDYLAPETFGGAAPTPQSDIWVLSALLHTWCSGRYPFEMTPPFGALIAIKDGQFLPFQGPAALAELVSRGLDPDPSARPSMAELIAALQASAS